MNNHYVRLVRMTFRKDKAQDFYIFFESVKQQIRDFKGCLHIALLKDEKQVNVYAFYSVWESKEHLEEYRKSDFYRRIWSQTKAMFDTPPSVWSYSVSSEA